VAVECIPFYWKECEQIIGGRCSDRYFIQYDVLGRNDFIGNLRQNQNFTSLGNRYNFLPIIGPIDCITKPFFPIPSDPFFAKYNVYNSSFTSLSVFIFLRGITNPFQLQFQAFNFRSPIEADYLNVFNFTQQGNDPCGSFDPTTLDECDCTPNQIKIPCVDSPQGFCCIDKPLIDTLCSWLN